MNLLQASKCVNMMQKHTDYRRQPAGELGELRPPNEKMLKIFFSLKVNKRKPQEPWKMYATGIPYLFHLDISDTIEDVA